MLTDAVGAGAGGFVVAIGWAGATVLRPAEDRTAATSYTFVVIEQGEVGSSITLNTVAEWAPVPVGANQAAGVVTGVNVAAGDEVASGSILYTVNLRPVVVAEGSVPAFRPMGSGVAGADIAQLQQFLKARGHDAGPVDGKAGAGTATAIRAGQKRLGIEATGVVEPGDIVFVPKLPTRVSLDAEAIARGKTLSGGEEVIRGLPETPVFTIPVTESQASRMPAGTQVVIAGPEGSHWEAITGAQEHDPVTMSLIVHLNPVGEGPICGEECGRIPAIEGGLRLSTVIVTVPTVAGLVVPSAALIVAADGTVSVIDEEGERHPVTVVSSARGISVIEGAPEGMRVRVPASDGPCAPRPPHPHARRRHLRRRSRAPHVWKHRRWCSNTCRACRC